jgi:hypothetical protein
MHRIAATARKALNDAMYGEARLITFNPAVKLPRTLPRPTRHISDSGPEHTNIQLR